MEKKIAWVSASILAFFCIMGFSQSDELNAILEKTKQSVISFTSFDENGEKLFQGTGFLIGKELMMTNYHLVSQAKEVKGQNYEGKNVKIEGIFAVDKNLDLALVMAKRKDPPFSFADSDEIGMGKKVFVIGGDELGEIKAEEDEVKKIVEITPYQRIIESSEKLPEEFCGAPVCNTEGRVLGMMVFFEGRTSFILPANMIKGLSPKQTLTKFKDWNYEDYFSSYEGASLASHVFYALDDTGKAQKYLERLLKFKPGEMETLNLLGTIYTKQRNYSSAVSTYKKIIEIDPNKDDAHFELGLVYLRMMRWNEAIPSLEKAAQLNLDHKTAHLYIGDAYRELKEYEKAVKAYEKFLSLNPEEKGDVYQNLGQCQFELQEYEKAIHSFREALKSSPQDVKINYRLAQACQNAGKFEEAAKVYEELARITPEDAKIYFNTIVRIYDEAKLPEKAIEAAKKLLEFDPRDADAIYNLGYMYVKVERYDEAIATFQKAIEIKPDFEYAYANIGYCYNKQKKYKESVEAFQKLVEIAPENVDGWLNIGIGFMLQKKFSSALDPLQKAIELKPDFGIAYYNLGVCYLNLKDNYSARETYKKLSTLDADLAEKLGKLLQ